MKKYCFRCIKYVLSALADMAFTLSYLPIAHSHSRQVMWLGTERDKNIEETLPPY
jgi:hypothetical protein